MLSPPRAPRPPLLERLDRVTREQMEFAFDSRSGWGSARRLGADCTFRTPRSAAGCSWLSDDETELGHGLLDVSEPGSNLAIPSFT
jgi:hypothetical protein